MGLTQGSEITFEDFISLKARVKAEMTRRNQTGSLAEYAGASYDYTVAPVEGGEILPEHYDKLITPLNAIASTGYTATDSGDESLALNVIDAKITLAESYALRGSASGCASSCSGLCAGCTGNCVGGCTSCSGCSGGCTACTSCSGSCTSCTSCTGGCSVCYGCTGTCNTVCNGCEGTCSAMCKSTSYPIQA